MKILFIGNSHTYFNDMPNIFKNLCRENNIKAEVTMLARGYKGLDYHCKEPQTRFNILYGDYDYVVLQHLQSGFDKDILLQSAEKLKKFIIEGKSTGIFYMPWTLKNEREKQEYMTSGYFEAGKKLDMRVAPAGVIWWKYFDKFPKKNLYFTDDKHPSELGSALAAITIFHTIFNKTPDTNNPDYKDICDIINQK